MSTRNGARGAVTFWFWGVAVVAIVLAAGFVYTVFIK